MFKLTRVHKIQIVLFALASATLLGVFAYFMGDFPFWNKHRIHYHVTFHFSSGLLRGSPVRIGGVGVGKVIRVSLNPTYFPPVTVTVAITPQAAQLIKTDSQFVINTVGIMGESYLEITPGQPKSPALPSTQPIRGIDPPRIDELIAEGYQTFRSVNRFLTDWGPVVEDISRTFARLSETKKNTFFQQASQLVIHLNTLLARVSSDPDTWRHMASLIRRMDILAGHATSQDAAHLLRTLISLLQKADLIDEKNLRQFLQKEGIRAHIF